ncbi:MarR family winged helix-turn-helix transcriptional regulator [Roseomonas sp. BN140053]|uniref:MarR family winged helix-turn-helix transcriptional regulator n=1 Tax=Roseomonas sp. BN140053 TaxID=3391898 RepID=UPI0039E85ABD
MPDDPAPRTAARFRSGSATLPPPAEAPDAAAAPRAVPRGADPLDALYERPGFKLRRAHQISLSVFAEECRAHDVTNTQFGVLTALRHRPGLDQVGLSQVLGLDRSTTGMVVGLLERRGLLRRDQPSTDRRRRVLALTPAGEELLDTLAPAAERARQRLLAPLTAAEEATLHALLDRVLSHHDAAVRVPLRRGEPAAED